METQQKEIIVIDSGYECCKRFYFYGKHNFKCKQVNKLKDHDTNSEDTRKTE
jgi:hypothetical protein